MKPSNFLFRVDSSFKIGSGHLMRCLTLAESLRFLGNNCTFVSRAHEGNLNKLIISKDFSLIELPQSESKYKYNDNEPSHADWRDSSWEDDALQTISALKKEKYEWIVVDHYGLWEPWEIEIKDHVSQIMIIDDIADRSHECDLLLDQNLDSNISKYSNLLPKKIKTLFGPQYSLLRPEFQEYREESLLRRKAKKVKNILINFGGGDPNNYIKKTLQSIENSNIPQEIIITVITGRLAKNNKGDNYIETALANKIVYYDYVENMAELLTNTDLVIGAAGSTSWERCCLGVPSIIFSIAKNQDEIARSLSDSGASFLMSEDSFFDGSLSNQLNKLIHSELLLSCSNEARKITDGKGTDRVIREIYD